jgi:hypothetical protein
MFFIISKVRINKRKMQGPEAAAFFQFRSKNKYRIEDVCFYELHRVVTWDKTSISEVLTASLIDLMMEAVINYK